MGFILFSKLPQQVNVATKRLPFRLCQNQNILLRRYNSTETKRGLRVMFFGTDAFAKTMLKALHGLFKTTDPKIEELVVVCPPRKLNFKETGTKGKRKTWVSAVEGFANNHGLPVAPAPQSTLRGWNPPRSSRSEDNDMFDIGVVASFGYIIPERIIRQFRKGMINVHPSLLPKYRGPSPLQTAIANGDEMTGVTIQELHPFIVDGGNILAQVPFRINPLIKKPELEVCLATEGAKLLSKAVVNLDYLREHAVKQDESKVVNCYLTRKSTSKINWMTMTAEEIYRMHRAYCDTEPVHCFWAKRSKYTGIQFISLNLAPPNSLPLYEDYLEYYPGTAFHKRKCPYIEIVCQGGGRLHITEIRAAGKSIKTAREFINGNIKKNPCARFLTGDEFLKMPTINSYKFGQKIPDIPHLSFIPYNPTVLLNSKKE